MSKGTNNDWPEAFVYTALFLCITTVILATVGEPDLIDALVKYLMQGS